MSAKNTDITKLADSLERSSSVQTVSRTKLEKLATIALLHEQISMKRAGLSSVERFDLREEDKE